MKLFIISLSIVILLSFMSNSFGQKEEGKYFISANNGCKVYCSMWYENIKRVTWTGKCQNGYATGKGTVNYFDKSNNISYTYIGEVLNGKHNGQGEILYPKGGKDVGLFINHIHRQEISYMANGLIGREGIRNSEGLFTGKTYYEDGKLFAYYIDHVKYFEHEVDANSTLQNKLKKLNISLTNPNLSKPKQKPNTVSSSSSSNSSSSSSNNAEMERRYNRERPCKVEKGEVTDWNYSDPNESPNWRYLKFTVYKPKENGDYEEINAELEFRVYRAGMFDGGKDRYYYLTSRPKESSKYDKLEEAFERMMSDCGCNNGFVMK